MIHATRILSDFAAGLRYEDIPAEAVEQAKLYLADYLAAAFAGRKVNGAFNAAAVGRVLQMGGVEEADALFSDRRLPAENAAFVNALYAHGADMDDGNRKAMGHVGAHVFSAVLALGQALGTSGRELIAGAMAGYEVYNRVAAAAQPGLVHRGFHSTGTAGGLACAAACAKLLGLGADGIYHAMALAAVQASGLMLVAESGQACKPLNPANAARTGLFSARLAAAGVEGGRYPLESGKGWFHAMSEQVDEQALTEGLGQQFTICESYLKPYPSCRHTHCGIEAALDLRRRIEGTLGRFDPQRVRKITVRIYENAIRIAGGQTYPAGEQEAKFSIRYTLAAALVWGRFGFEELTPPQEGPVRRLADLVELVPDESMEDRREGIRGARLQLELEDGSAWESLVPIPKGDAQNPFTWKDMKDKMAACMGPDYGPEALEEVLARLRALEDTAVFAGVRSLL